MNHRFARARAALATAADAARRALGPVAGSLRNHLNLKELGSLVIAGIVGGATVQSFLSALYTDLPNLVAPGDYALVSALLAAIIEGVRRYRQGRSLGAILSVEDYQEIIRALTFVARAYAAPRPAPPAPNTGTSTLLKVFPPADRPA